MKNKYQPNKTVVIATTKSGEEIPFDHEDRVSDIVWVVVATPKAKSKKAYVLGVWGTETEAEIAVETQKMYDELNENNKSSFEITSWKVGGDEYLDEE